VASIDDGFDSDDVPSGERFRRLGPTTRAAGVSGAGERRRRIEEIWELRRLREQIDGPDGRLDDVIHLLR
jgi:hypothetical protein